jgi:uncharacterized membrane protein (UPF0127 family)
VAQPYVPHAALLVDGRPVGPLEVARTRSERARGLLGRASVDGALWLEPARSIHTVGMAMPIDVALCRADGRVVRVLPRLVPGRITWPRAGVRLVVEAGAGSLGAWGVEPGSVLSVGYAGAGAPCST